MSPLVGKRENSRESSGGPGPASSCLSVPLCLFHSSAPNGYTSFSIDASPGVVVDVAHSPPAKKNRTGPSRWLLDPGLEVSLRMRAASNSTSDQKVSVAAVAWDVEGAVSRGHQISRSVCPALTPQP